MEDEMIEKIVRMSREELLDMDREVLVQIIEQLRWYWPSLQPNTGDYKHFVRMPGPFVCWKDVEGVNYIFRVGQDVENVDLTSSPKKEATFEDHLEALYYSNGKWYRHAGGGRGFYWTQELEVAWGGK